MSKYFGVFPFYITDNKLLLSKSFLPTLLVLFGVTILQVSYLSEDIRTYLQAVDIQRFKQLFISLHQIVSCIPVISIIWIRINMKQLTTILETIAKIEKLTQISSTSFTNRALTVFYVLVPSLRIFIISYRCVIKPSIYCRYSVLEALVITLNILQKYLVIIQFIYLSSVLKYQYQVLSRTLSEENAIEWTKCHEALGINCRILSKCYSPQLLLYIGGTFVTAIIDIYVDIMSSAQRTDLVHNIISIVRNILGIVTTWYIIYVCDGTAEEVCLF